MVSGDTDTLVSFGVRCCELLRGDEAICLGYLVEDSAKLVVGTQRDLSVWVPHVLDERLPILAEIRALEVIIGRLFGVPE